MFDFLKGRQNEGLDEVEKRKVFSLFLFKILIFNFYSH